MGKRATDYPHTISFRLTNEAWLGIQKETQSSDLTPHEWCRRAALEGLMAIAAYPKASGFCSTICYVHNIS